MRPSAAFAHAGSVYALGGGAVGPRAGTFPGATMLCTYLVFPWVSGMPVLSDGVRHSAEFADVVGPRPRLMRIVETDVHASANDAVVRRDGPIWFTDPSYGALQGFRDAPVPGDQFDPATGRLAVVATGLDEPDRRPSRSSRPAPTTADSVLDGTPVRRVVGRDQHVDVPFYRAQ